jgi:hypothetical protein
MLEGLRYFLRLYVEQGLALIFLAHQLQDVQRANIKTGGFGGHHQF